MKEDYETRLKHYHRRQFMATVGALVMMAGVLIAALIVMVTIFSLTGALLFLALGAAMSGLVMIIKWIDRTFQEEPPKE